jgi:serine/threonine-protein kinase
MGGGGMGAVYRALDEHLDREVALKILITDVEDPERRFRAEAVAIARLSHPGIAAVYELFQHDGQWVMVMELVRGETLEQVVDRTGPLAPRRAAELCMQALQALAHAHKMGVVHRDLKPSNLMITEAGAVKIMDFGIARVAGAERLTNQGFMMGTPAYMAPEQVLGHDLDGRADLYAMGVLFYRVITGKLPFKGDTPYEMAQAHLKDQPIPVDLIRPDVPLWVKYILDLALAKSPDQRFQSADEFHAACARALSETTGGLSRTGRTDALPRSTSRTEPMARPPAASTGRTSRRVRPARRPPWRWVAATAAGVLVIAATILAWPSAPAREPSTPVNASAPPADPPAPRVTAIAEPPATSPRVSASVVKTNVVPPPPPRREPPARTNATATATLAAFSDLKLLVIDPSTGRGLDRDIVLNFTAQQFTVQPPNGSAPLATMPYSRILKATYVRARQPQWDPALAAPPETLQISGANHHWLVVQAQDSYVILRLDRGWQRLLEAFESLTSRPIDRP